MTDCPTCDGKNPPGLMKCRSCGIALPYDNPTVFHEYRKPKLALFNIEQAVLDTSQSKQIAKQTTGRDRGKAFNDSVAANLNKERLRPGVKEFINGLVSDKIRVAYVSEKAKEHMSRQKEHLQYLGIPLMSDGYGVLLYGDGADSKTMKKLSENYDIQFYFGKAVKSARRHRIPGTFSSIEEYNGAPKNPSLIVEETPGPYTLVNPSQTFFVASAGYDYEGIDLSAINIFSTQEAAAKYLDSIAPEEHEAGAGDFQHFSIVQRQLNTPHLGFDEERAYKYTPADYQFSPGTLQNPLPAPRKQKNKKSGKSALSNPLHPQHEEIIEAATYISKNHPYRASWDAGRGETEPRMKNLLTGVARVSDFVKELTEELLVATSENKFVIFGANGFYTLGDSHLYPQMPASLLAQGITTVESFNRKYPNEWVVVGPMSGFGRIEWWWPFGKPTKSNPVPKPRKQKNKKNGKSRREPSKKYFNRLMGKLAGEFPETSQRAAVALSQVEKYYGKRGRNVVTKDWAKENPDFHDPRTGVSATGISEEAVEMALMLALQESGTDPNVAKTEARQVLDTLSPQAILQGNRQQSSVYADKVIIQGDRNEVNGYAMKSVIIQGDKNTGQITVPIGAQVRDQGDRNSINIRRVPIETFATEIYTALTGKGVISRTNPVKSNEPFSGFFKSTGFKRSNQNKKNQEKLDLGSLYTRTQDDYSHAESLLNALSKKKKYFDYAEGKISREELGQDDEYFANDIDAGMSVSKAIDKTFWGISTSIRSRDEFDDEIHQATMKVNKTRRINDITYLIKRYFEEWAASIIGGKYTSEKWDRESAEAIAQMNIPTGTIQNNPALPPPAHILLKARALGLYDPTPGPRPLNFQGLGNLTPLADTSGYNLYYHLGGGWVISPTLNFRREMFEQAGLPIVKFSSKGSGINAKALPPPPRKNPIIYLDDVNIVNASLPVAIKRAQKEANKTKKEMLVIYVDLSVDYFQSLDEGVRAQGITPPQTGGDGSYYIYMPTLEMREGAKEPGEAEILEANTVAVVVPENTPNPRKNPSKKKLKAAEKAYKDFHGGKKPDNVVKTQVDMGEIWYSLGQCWSIGYMSDKEGFGDAQKYIHHTNEDSKDGDYPMMYATMPESGEPMLIIKGGTMKIGMRDGLAWLID